MMKPKVLYSIGFFLFSLLVSCLLYQIINHNIKAASSLYDKLPVTVVLDPGHGGEDGGAVGLTGTRESDINLAISLRLEQVLTLCGIKTAMTRADDCAVYIEGKTISEKKASDLKQRVEQINTTWNPVLVSIHQNHFSDSKYDGAQVFYAQTYGSQQWAAFTQELLRKTLDPENKRKSKAASSVYLMEHIRCPGILVECGFLSNRAEEEKLCTDSYQLKIACAIGAAVAGFLEEGSSIEI